MPILHLQNGSLAYGYLPLFENADLRIDPGERIALIGRNGTGKSSLLKAIAGEAALDAGTVWREPGLRVARLDQEVWNDAEDRTVRDEIAFGPLNMGLERDAAEARVEDTLAMLGITELADRAPYQLSGGEKKRVAIASVLSRRGRRVRSR